MTCCQLEKAEMEWGTPPGRAIGTPHIFPQIFCTFLRDSRTPIFKVPKRRRKICRKSARKSAQKSAHQKSAKQKICAKICAPKVCTTKNLHKNLHTENLRKNGRKNLRTKICAKNRFEHSVFWKMEARKKDKKHLRQICAKPQPQFVSFRVAIQSHCTVQWHLAMQATKDRHDD